MPEDRGQRAATAGKPGADPLAPLAVIDRLEIGPARVEADRLTMPYRVHAGGAVEQTELAYRWEEKVFDPAEEADRALAGMIGAQVALNYGLFCDELVFHGPFDAADRRFLAEMAENTAREIYVKKFLQPNPFLTGAAASLPAVRRDAYLRARLVFPDADAPAAGRRPAGGPDGRSWASDPARAAVLSSGGKDSLLSYGLLGEIGLETHSIFVNESGRHWFTALQRLPPAGGRGARDHHPGLDQLRPRLLLDAAPPALRAAGLRQRLRSDEYPIRLWTVAVFLFGALPVLRARGIGRLVIGDEYDTTRRLRHEGITHYDGLYDQSRYFDQALTRYYQRKGWPLAQFSLLRQLSELLIQKILAERYPELLRQQVSCHATHIEDERTLPCGRCEKCRRIVGMLIAVGADPATCGYTPPQIEACLADLAARGVHQEAAGAEQLAWMLASGGTLPAAATGLARARRRPEVLQLRFDSQASPPDTMPGDLRAPLYRILLEHADGAVEKAGRGWRPLEVEEDVPAAPAAVSKSEALPADRGGHEPPAWSPFLLGEMTWEGAQRRFAESEVVLLPVGAIEQHGPHLPLDIDAWDADYLCRQVAARCADPKPLVLPLIPYGVSYHHDDFPGTLSVGPETLAQFVYEIGMAAARHGVDEAGHHQRPRRQRAGAAAGGADDQPRRPHLHLRRHRRDQRRRDRRPRRDPQRRPRRRDRDHDRPGHSPAPGRREPARAVGAGVLQPVSGLLVGLERRVVRVHGADLRIRGDGRSDQGQPREGRGDGGADDPPPGALRRDAQEPEPGRDPREPPLSAGASRPDR